MSLKRNIVANYLGQGWRALMSLAFVPVYIHLLGVEAYGLIGLFATLQAWLALLDMGLRPVLSREMARYTGGAHNAQSIADLLRSMEALAIAIALAFAVFLWAASDWLATSWVRTTVLPAPTVAQAFSFMAVVAAVQFVESLYTSAISGLQRQVLQNAIGSFISTLRAAGAVGVLTWVSPTIQAYFVWQGIVSLVSLTMFASAIYVLLPRPPRPPRFSWAAMAAVRSYAMGMVGITFLAFLLTQTDKIILSKQLPLNEFAHYTLAGLVAGSMGLFASPIGAAYYPRFTELVERGDGAGLRKAFHLAAQLTTVPLVSAAVILILFGERLLFLWTRDASLAHSVAPLLSIVAVGTMFNGLMTVPYIFQLAHGWTSLSIKINCVAVAVLVPTLIIAASRFGALGAAVVWATLNVAYVLIGAQFMFARLIGEERWSWYIKDIAIPLAAATAAGVTLRMIIPVDLQLVTELICLAAAGICVIVATGLSTPLVAAAVNFRSLLSLPHARWKVP